MSCHLHLPVHRGGARAASNRDDRQPASGRDGAHGVRRPVRAGGRGHADASAAGTGRHCESSAA